MQQSNKPRVKESRSRRRAAAKSPTAGAPLDALFASQGSGRPPVARNAVSHGQRDLIICLALLALIVAVYWPVYRFDFLNYDDAEYVSDNVRVQMGLTAGNLGWAFRTFFFENWHPLTWLSYMLDYQLFRLNPGAFHLVNVFFHALNTVLVFWVFKRMTGTPWPSAFVAGVFAVHPLHIESVAWIAERKDVLSSFFAMLTLWAYVRYVERPRFWPYFLALLFFALGLMAKPMLVTLPFLLLLLDFWPLGRLRFAPPESGLSSSPSSTRNRLRPTLHLLFEKAPFFLLTILSSIVTFVAQGGARVSTSRLGIGDRMGNALMSYVRYVGKTIWPDNLAVFYPHPGAWPAWQVAMAALLLAAATLLAISGGRKRPYLGVGWLWYVGTLVPVIGLVQVGEQAMADRYMYFPIIGLLIMLGWGAMDIVCRFRLNRGALILSGSSILLACLVVSCFQVRVWSNSLTLFEHALAVTSDTEGAQNSSRDPQTGHRSKDNLPAAVGVAHNSLGDALLSAGKTNEALAHFLAALEIDAEDPLALGNIGNLLLGQGKLDEALAKYQKGLQSSPKNPELNHNAGLCLAKLGRFSEAIPYYTAALQSRTEYADAYLNLGNALMGLGRFEAAMTNYQAVLRLKPNFGPAHFNLGNALRQLGRHKEAAAHYVESLRLQPENAEAHSNLAIGLAEEGNNREAITHLREALRLKPGVAQFHFQLASALGAANQSKDAVAQYEEALRLKPEFVLALNNLAWMLATDEDSNIRNGAEAVRCAQRACELTGYKQAFLMGTLAAAFAEASQFRDAVSTGQKAAEIATTAGQKEIAATNQKLIELYKSGKPYHENRHP